MAIVFTIINNKGGTGKTTTTLNLGAALARKKNKVLLIDLDAQSNLSSSLGVNGVPAHIGDALVKNKPFREVVIKREKLSLAPGSPKILEYEYQVNNEPGREYLLKECLDEVKSEYDYILIDCAPNLGIYSTNSLVAADYFIVPMQAENFAFIGLDNIIDISDKVKNRLNPDLDLAGILIVRQAQKTKFSQAVLSSISSSEKLKNRLFDTMIRQDISLMESAAFGQSIFNYAPKSRGAEDYKQFANEIVRRYGKK
ncbi:MAG: ParA family protein [Bacteroidota bacterium]